MLECKILDAPRVGEIYAHDLARDFPKEEIKPLSHIYGYMEKGRYTTLGFYEEGVFKAYAFLFKLENALLLDYFAVCPPYRGKGIGSYAIRLIKEGLSERDILICESEDPQKAKNNKEREKRSKRLSFYERNGFSDSFLTSLVFDVGYKVLYLNKGKCLQTKENIKNNYIKIYKEMIGENKFREKIKI